MAKEKYHHEEHERHKEKMIQGKPRGLVRDYPITYRRRLESPCSINPDSTLISHRFDRLTALRFSKGRNLP